jgi:hypothetical protein
MQTARVQDPVSAAFGDDKPAVTYDGIAAQVKSMQPRALTATQFDDVVVLIEFMRDQAVKIHDQNQIRSKGLDDREKAVAKRERDVSMRQRVHQAATRSRGLLRYFGR